MNYFSEFGFDSFALPALLIQPHTDQIAAANQEACRFFSMDVPSLSKRPVSSLFYSSRDDLLAFSEKVMSQGGKARTDNLYINRHAGGKTRVEIDAKHVLIEDRDYLQILISEALEIKCDRDHGVPSYRRSGSARVAKLFREFERKNQLILDAVGEGIYGVNAEGNTTFLNPAAERILGWSAEELIGRTMHEYMHHSHADGSPYCMSDCPIYQAFRDGAVHRVDNDVFWTRSGKAINVEYTSTPIRDNGRLAGAVVVFRDVTEKKADEKRLRDALDEVERLKNRLLMENAYLQEEINSNFNHHRIVGDSPAVQQLLQKIELVAPTNATVLIQGESGTGKELIARAIHENSDRAGRSLIRVNCAAIPADLFESEFFGHLKGAFTGAISDQPGRFELADGGTLFLDEVGEIPLPLQGKLLRVLQEQQFERVGEAKTRSVDVRILAATNCNLKERIEKGGFREDLYFRLNVFPIESVPLRERLTDVPLLAQHFLSRACRRLNKPGLKIPLSQIEKLTQYDWPGNIRELENIIERQVILARGNLVRFDDLNLAKPTPNASPQPAPVEQVLTEDQLRDYQRFNIIRALKKSRGKVFGEGGAAELLGIKATTLTSRIRKHKIVPHEYKLTKTE